MTQRRKQPQSLFTIFGIDVNLSSVLTTVVGGVSVFLITTAIEKARHNAEKLDTVIHDVRAVQVEQNRIKKDYAPEVKK